MSGKLAPQVSHPDINAGSSAPAARGRVVVVANGLFGKQLAGGDIHLLHSIRAFLNSGWEVECISGMVLKAYLEQWNLSASVISTDSPTVHSMSDATLGGKVRLFWEFFRRFLRALRAIRMVRREDVIFSPTDYWFDVLPVAFSKARLKVVILQMKAPSLWEVITRSRADVEPARVASLHYCLSQWVSLTVLRWCKNKRVVAVQPLLQAMLQQRGYRAGETPLIPNGVEVDVANEVGAESKCYDVAWMGRIHRQKGIEDLLQTLAHLAREIPDFRAVLIGNLRDALGPEVARLGLEKNVEFTGFVSGVEKFRWLKRARVFLMTSRHEGLPIVVGEALASELAVVAYELEMYRPFFGSLVRYVTPFKLADLQSVAADTVLRTRAGERLNNKADLDRFLSENAWPEVERRLAELL